VRGQRHEAAASKALGTKEAARGEAPGGRGAKDQKTRK